MQPFYKTVPCTLSEYFCIKCISQEKPSWDTITYILYLAFNHTKESVSLKRYELGYEIKLWAKQNLVKLETKT